MNLKRPHKAINPLWSDFEKVAQKYNPLYSNGTLCCAKDDILAAGQSTALKVDVDHLRFGGEV